MKAILTGSLVTYLKNQGTISALVGTKVYAKQIAAYRDMPAIAVTKLSQGAVDAHSGECAVYGAIMRLYVFAGSLADVEEIKQAVNALLSGKDISLTGIDASFSLTNDADFDEFELLEVEEWAGILEYEVNWIYSS